MSESFVDRLIGISAEHSARIANHEYYARMAERALPIRAVHAYLGELYPGFAGTLDRAILRAANTPVGSVKRLWLKWALEEDGHAEMLLDTIELTGGRKDDWRNHAPMYETEALIAYTWRLAASAGYLENVAAIFLGTEALFRQTFARFGRLLREVYSAPPNALAVLDEHEKADEGHVDYGVKVLADAGDPGPDQRRAIEHALVTQFVVHERWHDGLLRTYGR